MRGIGDAMWVEGRWSATFYVFIVKVFVSHLTGPVQVRFLPIFNGGTGLLGAWGLLGYLVAGVKMRQL